MKVIFVETQWSGPQKEVETISFKNNKVVAYCERNSTLVQSRSASGTSRGVYPKTDAKRE